MYDHLSDFLSELEDEGDLLRIGVEVDPVFELAEITDRVCKRFDGGPHERSVRAAAGTSNSPLERELPHSAAGGPALYFENVKGHSIPVVTNLLGSRRRILKALGAKSFDELAGRILGHIQPDIPETGKPPVWRWLETIKLIPQFAQLAKLPPKLVDMGVCQQVVKLGSDVNLDELPIPHCWPGESGPMITAGGVFTRSPTAKVRRVSSGPVGVRTSRTLAIAWNRYTEGWRMLEEHRRQGTPMPIAVALGGDPIDTYLACAPLPPNTDACLFGGFLRGKNMELVRCRSIELEVPAQAEIVLEGRIDTAAALESAGPFGCSSGYYTPVGNLPTVEVTAITHRSNPIFPARVVAKPPTEEDWLGKTTERLLLPFVKLYVPELVDLHQPRAGMFRNLLFVSIRKESPQQARQVMHALWGLGPLAGSKMIVVVGEEVDVQDEEEVWFTVGGNVHPGRDVIFCEGPTHPLDHAAPVEGVGHKLGIDATRKLPEEGHPRAWPEPLIMRQEIQDLVTRRWHEYGLG